MRLINELTFVIHEGSKIGYKFLIGTEQIWPVVSEVISFTNIGSVNERQKKISDADYIKLMKGICESNYSLFEIPGTVGHYNYLTKNINKIIRLKQPDDEERLLKGIVDDEDYNCWVVEKIYETTGRQEKAILVETSGDGIVKFYGINSSDEGELLCKWNAVKRNITKPLNDEERIILKEAISLLDNGGMEEKYVTKLKKVISKISAQIGKGAVLIFSKENGKVYPYLRDMEISPLDWQTCLDLDDPEYILRAALVMDGANLISNDHIKPRLVMYPFYSAIEKSFAWGLEDFLQCLKNAKNVDLDVDKIIEEFVGKGSKTHASSNLATLFYVKNNYNEADKDLVIISISADGPVKFWPHKILAQKKKA
jgi:hypothetical protein